MSKRKDRERAESGIIFRDGEYVSKEEWYAAHPTRETLAQQQAEVDVAVATEMAAKATKFSYFCSKCQHRHTEGSKICTEHRQYAMTPVTLRKEA